MKRNFSFGLLMLIMALVFCLAFVGCSSDSDSGTGGSGGDNTVSGWQGSGKVVSGSGGPSITVTPPSAFLIEDAIEEVVLTVTWKNITGTTLTAVSSDPTVATTGSITPAPTVGANGKVQNGSGTVTVTLGAVSRPTSVKITITSSSTTDPKAECNITVLNYMPADAVLTKDNTLLTSYFDSDTLDDGVYSVGRQMYLLLSSEEMGITNAPVYLKQFNFTSDAAGTVDVANPFAATGAGQTLVFWLGTAGQADTPKYPATGTFTYEVVADGAETLLVVPTRTFMLTEISAEFQYNFYQYIDDGGVGTAAALSTAIQNQFLNCYDDSVDYTDDGYSDPFPVIGYFAIWKNARVDGRYLVDADLVSEVGIPSAYIGKGLEVVVPGSFSQAEGEIAIASVDVATGAIVDYPTTTTADDYVYTFVYQWGSNGTDVTLDSDPITIGIYEIEPSNGSFGYNLIVTDPGDLTFTSTVDDLTALWTALTTPDGDGNDAYPDLVIKALWTNATHVAANIATAPTQWLNIKPHIVSATDLTASGGSNPYQDGDTVKVTVDEVFGETLASENTAADNFFNVVIAD